MPSKLIFDAIQVKETSFLSEDARALIWDVFFASKQRGVSLDYHFPWLKDDKSTMCLTLDAESNGRLSTRAALVIKKHDLGSFGRVGLVGLVCVDSKCRGQGLSTQLLKHATEWGKRSSLKSLVLWTTKAEVYNKCGYVIDDVDYFGSVKKIPNKSYKPEIKNPIYNTAALNRSDDGVPAFANQVVEYSTDRASVIVCNTDRGISLADWSGSPKVATQIIIERLPDTWMINTKKDSELVFELHRHGFIMDLKPGAARMVLALNPDKNQKIPHISILDRI